MDSFWLGWYGTNSQAVGKQAVRKLVELNIISVADAAVQLHEDFRTSIVKSLAKDQLTDQPGGILAKIDCFQLQFAHYTASEKWNEILHRIMGLTYFCTLQLILSQVYALRTLMS